MALYFWLKCSHSPDQILINSQSFGAYKKNFNYPNFWAINLHYWRYLELF